MTDPTFLVVQPFITRRKIGPSRSDRQQNGGKGVWRHWKTSLASLIWFKTPQIRLERPIWASIKRSKVTNVDALKPTHPSFWVVVTNNNSDAWMLWCKRTASPVRCQESALPIRKQRKRWKSSFRQELEGVPIEAGFRRPLLRIKKEKIQDTNKKEHGSKPWLTTGQIISCEGAYSRDFSFCDLLHLMLPLYSLSFHGFRCYYIDTTECISC